jgi:hypothetical protein
MHLPKGAFISALTLLGLTEKNFYLWLGPQVSPSQNCALFKLLLKFLFRYFL